MCYVFLVFGSLSIVRVSFLRILSGFARRCKYCNRDQKNAFIANGLDEETATDKAIKEMGDPILVGSEFDRMYRPKIEWRIIVWTGIAL